MSGFEVIVLHPHSGTDKEGKKKRYGRGDTYTIEKKPDLDALVANGIVAERKSVPTKEAYQEKVMDSLEKKGKGKKARSVKEGKYTPKKKKQEG